MPYADIEKRKKYQRKYQREYLKRHPWVPKSKSICAACGKDFTRKTRLAKHCSYVCAQKKRDTRAVKLCVTCKKEILVPLCLWNRTKYCSRECMGKHYSIILPGREESAESRARKSVSAKKRIEKYPHTAPSKPFLKGHPVPFEWKWNWKGGITSENHRIRSSSQYLNWRKAVFKRDDYRCLDCGERGGRLNADHIYSFALFPRLRLDINNGRTLCVECHRKTDTWGGKSHRKRDNKINI